MTEALALDRSNGTSPFRRVAVVGLGFAGLPTAVAIADAGFDVVGLDIDAAKVTRINAGEATSGVGSEVLETLTRAGRLVASTDSAVLATADAIVIAVPTPADDQGRPDTRWLESACRTVRATARDHTLLLLQSTVTPGTTRRMLVDPLHHEGRTVGRDIFVAYSPERVNPGDPVFRVDNTAKIVAGATPACTEKARTFVGSVVESVHVVSSLEAGELVKLVENTFRFINIRFVNELAVLCDRLNVSVWEVIEGAATKPFAFMPHWPGPGIGGDCIPVSPRYLEAAADERGLASELVAAGFRATDRMPEHVVDRCAAELGLNGRGMAGLKIAVIGVAYKPDVADPRNSPAVPVIRALCARGASVVVYDPLVKEIEVDGSTYRSVDPDQQWPYGLVGADAGIVVTPHSEVDYTTLSGKIPMLLDTRNALPKYAAGRVVPL